MFVTDHASLAADHASALPASCAIVGSNGAIGRAVAARLAAHGVAVHGFDLGPESATAVASYTRVPETDPDGQVDAFTAQLVEVQPDTLIIASGLYPARTLADETVASLQHTLTVNAIVPALMVRAFSEHHASEDPAVAVTSSLAALRPRVGTAAYSTSKVALERLLAAVALEYRDRGVRVNAVQPGYVSSQSTVNPIPDAYDAQMKATGAACVPEDLVDTFVWLVSPASRQLNGATLPVDRGMHLGSSTEGAWLS